jgi:hypothetical protein
VVVVVGRKEFAYIFFSDEAVVVRKPARPPKKPQQPKAWYVMYVARP